MPRKVVIDTDFGTDADDAIAVALAMVASGLLGPAAHIGRSGREQRIAADARGLPPPRASSRLPQLGSGLLRWRTSERGLQRV